MAALLIISTEVPRAISAGKISTKPGAFVLCCFAVDKEGYRTADMVSMDQFR